MTDKTGTLWAAILGSCIVFLDSSVVTVALPRIGRDLPAHFIGVLEGQSYVYSGYLLAESAFLILAGGLTDTYGRRRIFRLGLAGFGASSILSGLAPTLEWLVVFRILQGVAGALLVPGSLALITAAFSGEEQGRAFGVWSGASAGLAMVGPVVGGLVVGTISGQQREWRSPVAFAALAIGAVATTLLPWWMRRVSHPLVPPALFHSRNFTVKNLSTLVIYAALAVAFYYLPLFLQGTLGYSAAAAGVATVPGVLFMALFSARFGALATRFGARWFLVAGPTLMALGVLWLARVPSTSPAWGLRLSAIATFAPPAGYLTDLLPGLLVFGLGAMLMVAPLTAALMASVPVEHAGVASAINTAISDVGPQLAIAVLFVVMTTNFYGVLARDVPGLDVASPALRRQVAPLDAPSPGVSPQVLGAAREASTGAFRLAMLAGAALLLAGAAINAAVRTPIGGSAVRVASPDPSWRRCRHVTTEG